MAFPLLGNSDHIAISAFIDFPSNSKGDAPVHRIAYHLRDVPWEDTFRLGASAAGADFCEWVQVGIYEYNPHCKYPVKPHSVPSSSTACAAAIAHRNHFFCLYQQIKSSTSILKFRQACNHCKRVLEAAKLAYVMIIKQKIYYFPENWLS